MEEKEKVGIITIHHADNYGSVLQAYATQEAINELGYNAKIVNHICKKIDREYGIKRILDQKGIKKKAEAMIKILTTRRARKNFLKFKEDFYQLAEEKELKQQEYKKFLVGSDQVWNPKITDMDGAFFLDFVKEDCKKIAYASSFGITQLPKDKQEEYKQYLKKFKHIAVREEQAAKMIEELLQKEVSTVLDPTLLIEKEKWMQVIPKEEIQTGYILVYQIAHSPSLVKFAERLATKTNKQIISIQGSMRQKFSAKYIWNAGPAEYIQYFLKADYIITNSFHGTAFSINFNKKFFTELLPSFEKTSSRLENILDTFDLRSRQIVDGTNEEYLSEIDYTKVNEILKQKKKESIQILKQFIED